MKFLDRSLAQEIVDRTMEIIKRNINVMNAKGVIIGSGDKSRIDSIHEGALKVIERQAEYEIGDQEAEELHGVKAGINLPIFFRDKIVGVIGITGPPEEIRNYGELVKMAAEMILQRAFLMEEMQWDERLREELISQLLHGTDHLNSFYFERIKRLGIDLDIPRIAVIFRTQDPSKLFKAIRERLRKEDLYVMYPDHFVLLFNVSWMENGLDTNKLKQEMEKWIARIEKYDAECKISIGSFYPFLKGLSQSYQEALLTSKVGKKLDPDQSVYLYEDYKLPVFLGKANELGIGGEFSSLVEKLKQNDKKGELLETLIVYIEENKDTNAVVGKLFIHRNTLRYRLDRITEITGKDPRKVRDLLELYLAYIQDYIS